MSYYAKICYQGDGVTQEKQFKTKEEAEAFCLGFDAARDELDNDDVFEDYFCCVDTTPAKEE